MTDGYTPAEWLSVKLGEVVDYGKAQKCELSDVSPETWVLELEDIEKDSSRIVRKLNAKERPFKSAKNKFQKGDVLYGKLRPYLNKVVIADEDGVCSTEIIPLNAEPYLHNRYLFHWIKSEGFLNYVNAVSYGVNMPRLGTKDGKLAPLMLPSVYEQKIIASKIDEMLSMVQAAKGRLEYVPDILKRFRESVLSAAMNGKLTEGKSGTSGWKNSELKKVTSKIGSGATPKGGENVYQKSGIPLVRSLNIYTTFIKYKDLAFINKGQAEKLKNVEIESNDVLLNITGASIGRVNVAPKEFVGGRVNQHVAIIRCKEQELHPKFLYFFLASPRIQKWIEAENYGATRQALTKKMIEDLDISYPSLRQQVEIVQRVDYLLDYAEGIEKRVHEALCRVNRLTQSILTKAFRGEFTAEWRADNPDLISGENSADALLQRVNAGRVSLARKPRNKTTRKKNKVGTRMSKQIIKVVSALGNAEKPLSGQELKEAAGYPSNSTTEQLEQFFLDLRNALTQEKSIVKLERDEDGQDIFALAGKE